MKAQSAKTHTDLKVICGLAFDAVQKLYDRDQTRWQFVMLESSARKRRQTGANLLPDRALLRRLMPLILAERPSEPNSNSLTL